MRKTRVIETTELLKERNNMVTNVFQEIFDVLVYQMVKVNLAKF